MLTRTGEFSREERRACFRGWNGEGSRRQEGEEVGAGGGETRGVVETCYCTDGGWGGIGRRACVILWRG